VEKKHAPRRGKLVKKVSSLVRENFGMRTEKNEGSPEMAKFNSALRGALSISKSDLNRLLSEEKVSHNLKQKPGRKPKSVASAHVSSDKG
jgi:hypothetical protein